MCKQLKMLGGSIELASRKKLLHSNYGTYIPLLKNYMNSLFHEFEQKYFTNFVILNSAIRFKFHKL